MTDDGLVGPQIGDEVTFRKTVGETDVYLFAGVTGDLSPVHVDAEYMSQGAFGERIAHGVLLLGYSSTASAELARRYQLRAVSYGYDRVRFTAPVFFGNTIAVKYTVARIDREVRRIRSNIEIVREDGAVCLVATHILQILE